MAKECRLSTGKVPLRVLPRDSVVRITDSPNMTSAVYSGCKATYQTNELNIIKLISSRKLAREFDSLFEKLDSLIEM